MGKFKPFLISGLVAIVAVYVYNNFIAAKFNLPTA
jgi:hypothetical protein